MILGQTISSIKYYWLDSTTITVFRARTKFGKQKCINKKVNQIRAGLIENVYLFH